MPPVTLDPLTKKLTYSSNIMDFSSVGISKPFPKLSTLPTINVSKTGSTIQEAINKVSELPLVNGFRGVIFIPDSEYIIPETLVISTSGVIIKGESQRKTILKIQGPPKRLFQIGTPKRCSTIKQTRKNITDVFVPVGSKCITVTDTTGYTKGDLFLIKKTITPEWIHFMKMDTLVRNGQPQTWLSPNTEFTFERTIVDIVGNKIIFDPPISDTIDSKWNFNSYIVKFNFPRIENVCIVHVSGVAPENKSPINQPNFSCMKITCAENVYIKNVSGLGFTGGLGIENSKQITIENCTMNNIYGFSDGSSGWPSDYSIDESQQVLLKNCKALSENTFCCVTHARTMGPNVIFGMKYLGKRNSIYPHQRWATGLLVDNCEGPSLDFVNRKTYGSGHGWCIGHGIVWNCKIKKINIENCPDPNLIHYVVSNPEIPSLYLAQLEERENLLL